MRISGGGGASSHHESTHSNSHPSHSAVSHHEASARSAPARSAPVRRENPATAHHSEPAHDTVHISLQAARLERLMSSQDKITQSSLKPAPQPEKKESSGGFWSKLVDKVSNVAQKVEQTTKKVEQAVSKEAGHVEQAAKQVAHEAEQSIKAVLQEAKHVETKAANVLHQTAHEAEKVAQKAESSVSKNAHKIASKVEQEAEKAGRTLQKDAKEIASKVSKETEKIGYSAVTSLKNAEHTVSQGLKAAEQRERKIANGIAKDVQSVEQKVQSSAKHLEKRAIQAYQATQQAVGQAVGDVQHSVHQARQEADKIESNIEKGARNLAAHPGATVSATLSVVGGAAEAVAGVTFAAATSETGVGLVAGSAVAIDGGAHAVAGLGDLASIFNGNMSKVGTHNILENMAGRIGGQNGRNIYNAASTTVGLVIPGSDVNSAREVLTSVSSHTKGLLSTAKEFVTNAIPSRQFRPVYAGNIALIGGHMKFEPVRMENNTQMTMVKTLDKPGGVAGRGTEEVNHNENTVRIINKKYAGKTYHLDGELGAKYPNGVQFNQDGFPDFSPYSKATVKVKGLTGKNSDFTAVNKAVGLKSTPTGYTWHHVEDGKTMQLVPTDLHSAVKHTGGAALLRKGLVPK